MSVNAAAQISKFNFGGPGHIDRSLRPALQDQTPDHQIKFEWDTSHLAIKITNTNMANDAIVQIILPYENGGPNVQMCKSSYRIEVNQVYNDITLMTVEIFLDTSNAENKLAADTFWTKFRTVMAELLVQEELTCDNFLPPLVDGKLLKDRGSVFHLDRSCHIANCDDLNKAYIVLQDLPFAAGPVISEDDSAIFLKDYLANPIIIQHLIDQSNSVRARLIADSGVAEGLSDEDRRELQMDYSPMRNPLLAIGQLKNLREDG